MPSVGYRSVSCMSQVEVEDTGSPWIISRSIEVEAPAERIFELLADPRRHADFDGSGSVKGSVSGPERLSIGAKFGMDMRLVVPYRIGNQVKEFDEGRRIAWAHLGGHRWRYELESLEGGSTRVTETFDGTTARTKLTLKVLRADAMNAKAIDATLCRLKDYVEGQQA